MDGDRVATLAWSRAPQVQQADAGDVDEDHQQAGGLEREHAAAHAVDDGREAHPHQHDHHQHGEGVHLGDGAEQRPRPVRTLLGGRGPCSIQAPRAEGRSKRT
jgi:hypothetical protein